MAGIGSRVLDLLYPPCCELCGEALAGGAALCATCDEGLPRLSAPFCQSCGEPFEGRIDGVFDCPNCGMLRFAFDFARPAMPRNERLRELIHRLKYERRVYLAGELGRLAAGAFEDPRLAPALAGGWPLVPVPLHVKRLRHRHFNQAVEIARALSGRLGLPVCEALRRSQNTSSQTLLSRRERQNNLRGAFQLSRDGARLLAAAPAGVILIDDVLTTGSTIDACARVLRKSGFRAVVAVTVMRG
jgi:competence protein ComFC